MNDRVVNILIKVNCAVDKTVKNIDREHEVSEAGHSTIEVWLNQVCLAGNANR